MTIPKFVVGVLDEEIFASVHRTKKNFFQISFYEYMSYLEMICKIQELLAISCVMLKNGQTYFKNLAVFIPQDF